MNDIFCHPYSMQIRGMIIQEETHPFEDGHAEETDGVILNISILFSAGIAVKKDQAYSDFLFDSINPVYKQTAMSEGLFCVADVHDDLRFAEHLLSRRDDPRLIDCADDMSILDVARRLNNTGLLEVFERREFKAR